MTARHLKSREETLRMNRNKCHSPCDALIDPRGVTRASLTTFSGICAKGETLEQRETFREAFQQRRCVVPADGFYEWTGPKGKRQPLWIHPRAGDLMLFAGLYESWYPERKERKVTFTIVTCAANAVIGGIHDRMPVILDERAAEGWMNPREKAPLL